MSPADYSNNLTLRQYTELVDALSNAPNVQQLERLRDLLGQLIKLTAQEALLSWQRHLPQEITDARDQSQAYQNHQVSMELQRHVQRIGNDISREFKQEVLGIFGPLGVENDSISPILRPGLRTDFAPVRQLFLAYPEGVKGEGQDYTHLAIFFEQLISLVPKEIEVVILVKTRLIADKVRRQQLRGRFRCVVCSDLQNIWLRDTVGFNCGTRLLKPRYSPLAIGESMEMMHSLLGMDLEHLHLWWEGGNLVTNGDFALVSTAVLQDNHTIAPQEVERQVTEALDMPVEWVELPTADKLSHTDGYVTFIGPRQALVSTYPASWATKYPKDQECVDLLAERLQGMGIEVERLSENPIDEPAKSPIDSTVGIYVNFLQLNKTWLVPTYGLASDEAVVAQLRRLNVGGEVKTIECTELAELGGVLHCISFCN
ncbi:agmatine deiminase family protein [Hymenobacter sp. M29]|uniref:Agmatine deiminase family protein n=1 Tax=Hymenobacter mellowenesis TaxID=3063995 RepID=A0ABT9AFS3_9BACT|nr:agmatine deiminase family protein [Hymenobacter sp. M29]MDO7848713.1 agmatine deiminase family protein [Hymenobacter sp. M29]